MSIGVLDILKNLPLKQGGVVLDIGCGIGKITKELSPMVPNGKIIALEIDENKLASLENDIHKNKHFSNIKTLKFDVDGGKPLPLKDNACDAVILTHTLRHIVYRESLLKECQRVLRPGGIILVTETQESAFGVPSHPDARILFDDMLEYLDRAGFLLGENFDTKHEEYGIIGVCPQSSEE